MSQQKINILMYMKRLTLIILTLLCTVVSALAVEKSQTVVYINGSKYYIHTLKSGDTLESVAELYRVSKSTISDNNPTFSTLKSGENIKVPYFEVVSEGEQISGLRKIFAFNKHKVSAGETLYAISRKYEISIETILEDNPSIDPVQLSIDQVILIRKSEKGLSSEEQSQSEWDEYKSNLNMIAHQEDYSYHIVAPGETIYSLSREAGISEAEFIELNNLEDGLKAGAIVKMSGVIDEDDQTIYGETADGDDSYEEPTDGEIHFKALGSDQRLNIALMLPLSSDGKPVRIFAEFYRGFLMGLEEVKREWGRTISLTLYDTKRSVDEVAQVVESEEFEGTNLIVGPIYENELAPVIAYAEANNIPVVSPLSAINKEFSPSLFQLAPPAESKYNKVESMFADTKHITLIYTESVDSLFEADVKQLLGAREYATHDYAYEHPNIVAEKLKEGEESASDLTNIICNGLDNTVVVMSNNETDVDRILSALSSAQINFVARGGKSPKYEVLGNSTWSRYNNIDRTILFKNSVVLLSSYHAKRDAIAVKIFDSDYVKEFGAMPSLYAYRGYDAAVIFGEGLYSDIEYNMEGRVFSPLQSQYRFEVDPLSGVHINREWLKVKYNNNYTITDE